MRQDAEYAAAAALSAEELRSRRRSVRKSCGAQCGRAAAAALSAEELRRLRVARFAPAPAPPPD